MKKAFLLLALLWTVHFRRYTNYNVKVKLKNFSNKIYMSSRVQLKSTKLQHRKRPKKRKKSEIYRTPVLYHPNQKDYFNLQSEYTCLPDEQVLQLLSKDKLSLLIRAIRRKDNQEIDRILYKDVNDIYLDRRYVYYEERGGDTGEDKRDDVEEEKRGDVGEEKRGDKRDDKRDHNFVDLNNIYFYFKKVNITNINKENINEDIYKELVELKRVSLEKGDQIGVNLYRYFLNIITNVDRMKYIDDFYLVNYINNIWVTKNVHKYFYFLNSLFDRMKKISYKLFQLNYKIDQIGHEEETNKMKYFERHELFSKVIKKTKFVPNYVRKHSYAYATDIMNLYRYDVNTNSYMNMFESTYREVCVDDFVDSCRRKSLNICHDAMRFDPFYSYARGYPRENEMKKIMGLTYGAPPPTAGVGGVVGGVVSGVAGGGDDGAAEAKPKKAKRSHAAKEVSTAVQPSKTHKQALGEHPPGGENPNSHTNEQAPNGVVKDATQNQNRADGWLERIKKDPNLKYKFLEKISEKMCSEFVEMGVLDNESKKIDLNKIEDIKNDQENILYKKVYAMRDYFYNIMYDHYKPNLDIYELETFIDAEYRTYSYKKDLNVLFRNWVLNENKQLPTVHFAKKDVELAKLRYMSKRKRKVLEFDQRFLERHGEGKRRLFPVEEHAASEVGTTGASQEGAPSGGAVTAELGGQSGGAPGEAANGAKSGPDSGSDKGPHNNPSGGPNRPANKSLSCLIKWNVRSENDARKINDQDEADLRDVDHMDENDEGEDDTHGGDESFDFDKYNVRSNELESYGFCDENLNDSAGDGDGDGVEPSFGDMNFAKLVIYDDNYDQGEFVETITSLISTCDYKRAYSIYNTLKTKGKVDTLYFKSYDNAENVAFLMRQSKQRILADVEFL
ncbi:conserved Plasmodium protein, unknown function [Plasmodium vivax]|uniref:Uncharacterized protein n=6 Tax=Plasmodium vivax TaxID=5855 RepID=A5K9Z2_PLAVS|nr:hypothetical protein, conserved [Plasmodium vivax]KMZ82783.1 hypothetical protein PVIIG_03598 [Plasmodium vivax India VII]KMZ89280.1 hypothetical protein PVBG_03630 [Plasmodium vivax Brazil I]KMZ95601.1 hypothetical protein PVMG_04394 [Plasmodium vivax Mauritania I]KNA02066.1 hypothetical protein PVNG_04180 [Plasmodium vivax North Korean]EDL43880.1 hypothetical protein, conserved [Plasmodium vivax]|eukprot:XP_001613607.1 hypothetical protein [Plasmodium vivax Sal-1]